MQRMHNQIQNIHVHVLPQLSNASITVLTIGFATLLLAVVVLLLSFAALSCAK
jgi:hypothetical protein